MAGSCSAKSTVTSLAFYHHVHDAPTAFYLDGLDGARTSGDFVMLRKVFRERVIALAVLKVPFIRPWFNFAEDIFAAENA